MRYNILKDYVDEFIVVEFDKTFSGKDKPFYGKELDQSFSGWQNKIRYCYQTELSYSKYYGLAKASPQTEYGQGAGHWVREFAQKESIRDCIKHLKDNDTVFIGDCDEIWNPNHLKFLEQHAKVEPTKLKLDVYTYYLNNKSNEQFWGTIVSTYKNLKDEVLNYARTDKSSKTPDSYGWHFTSLKDGLKRKLEDSYTKETYATKQVLDNLEENIRNNKDFLGRDFKYTIDETTWPQYLKDNKDKYRHLLRHE